MEIPEFIINDKLLQNPFNSKGKPESFLKLLVPFVENEVVTTNDIRARVNIKTIQEKRRFSYHLTKLNKLGILHTVPRGKGYWRKGKNFKEYLQYLLMKLYDTDKRKGFGRFLHSYDNTVLGVIFKG